MSALEQSDSTVRSNGAPPEQPGRIAVQNPATGEVIGKVDDMSPAQVEAVVERARRAQPGWDALGVRRRAGTSCSSCGTGWSRTVTACWTCW